MATDQFIVFQLFWINPVGVPDASVHFADADALCPVAMKVAHRVKTHVTKTLQDAQDKREKKKKLASMNMKPTRTPIPGRQRFCPGSPDTSPAGSCRPPR